MAGILYMLGLGVRPDPVEYTQIDTLNQKQNKKERKQRKFIDRFRERLQDPNTTKKVGNNLKVDMFRYTMRPEYVTMIRKVLKDNNYEVIDVHIEIIPGFIDHIIIKEPKQE